MISRTFCTLPSPVALLLIMLIQMAAASLIRPAAFDEGYTITLRRRHPHRRYAPQPWPNPPLTNVAGARLLRDEPYCQLIIPPDRGRHL
jgi:hypothetical protein